MTTTPRRISLAPMLDWTDRHYRFFLRQITSEMYLYTEMVNTGAILKGDRSYQLDFSKVEHPLALQLGGSNAAELAQCAHIAQEWGYDEVNLNVGCPSSRVQSASFGACLMATPEVVADAVSAMKAVTTIPITVKTRLGIDEHDSWEFLEQFITTVKSAGCDTFILHARKAWLQGLSPKQNRDVPPLNYERVHRVKELWPELEISINGGLRDLDHVAEQLKYVDGVMIGREAYENPYALSSVDSRFYGVEHPIKTRKEIFAAMIPYMADELQRGGQLKWITRHLMGLYHGVDGARWFRRQLSDGTAKGAGDVAFLENLLSQLSDDL